MSGSEMTKFTCVVDSNKQYNKITIFLTNGITNTSGVIKIRSYEKTVHIDMYIVIVMTLNIHTPVRWGWQFASTTARGSLSQHFCYARKHGRHT